MFDHLDDPATPAPRPATDVAARGAAIRNRRRYAAGGAIVAAGALLLVTTVPGGGSRRNALEIAVDPTPSASETYVSPEPLPSDSMSASASASPSASPSASASAARSRLPMPTTEPEPTEDASPPSEEAPFDPAALTPRRAPQPPIAACTKPQEEQTHPTGTAPPAGVVLSAEITSWTAKTISRGAYWTVDLTIRNTGEAPVTFEDRGRAAGVYLDGRYVAGRPEGSSPYPQPPSTGQRTIPPGESIVIETLPVSSWTCARDVSLPMGGYDLSTGIRTESGTWYAPSIRGWVGDTMGSGTCFNYDDRPGRVAPAPGLALSVEGVPSTAATPETSFTARLVVTNTSNRPVEFTDLEPGRRVAYLMKRGGTGVSGGWTAGREATAVTYRLAPGDRHTFDVPVRGEACRTAQPISGTWYVVTLGIVTERDGQPYLWTARGGQVTYPG